MNAVEMVTIEEKLTKTIGKLFGKAEKKEPLFNTTKLTFQIENTNVVREFAIGKKMAKKLNNLRIYLKA